MTTDICRAANGRETCRVHGSKSPAGAVFVPEVAIRNLAESEKAYRLSSSLEESSENAALIEHDQVVYDSTVAGLGSLTRKARLELDALERYKLQERLKAAVAYRKSILAEDPVYQESETNYKSVVEKSGIQSVPLVKDALKEVAYGTPLAIKLKDGGFIYDHAGNGWINGKVPMILKPIVGKGSFVDKSFSNGYESSTKNLGVSLQGIQSILSTDAIEELHVLDANAFEGGFDKIRNTNLGSYTAPKPNDNVKSPTRFFSIKTENSLYEMELRRSSGFFVRPLSGETGIAFTVNADDSKLDYKTLKFS